MIAFALILTAFGCGRAQSPADSIALGRAAHACDGGGTWDGLECAKPHVEPDSDEPTNADHPKPTTRKRGGPMLQPIYDPPCDCEQQSDPLCSCD